MHEQFKAFLNCDPSEIKEKVILSPIISTKTINSAKTASKSRLGYLVLNTAAFTFIKCPRGSNWAAELVPLLKSTNCKRIIFLGVIGGLSDNLKIGDLVAGESAQIVGSLQDWISDSVSININKSIPASSNLLKKINLHKGSIASIPLIVKETNERLEKLINAGFMGIDMETAPLYLACKKEGIEVLGIYIISDLPLSNPFYSKDFTFPKTENLIKTAAELIKA